MSEIEFGHTRFVNLTDEQQKDMRRWRTNVEEETEGPKSLWVYGQRGAGSSYAATCALHKMVVDHRDWNYEYHRAIEVMDAMRNFWTLNQQMGPNPDHELIQEHMLMDDEFRWLWDKADIIFIDDIYASLDLGFWRNHIYDHIEKRVKEGKPTILAGSVAPNHSAFEDITRVIENHFVIVHAGR